MVLDLFPGCAGQSALVLSGLPSRSAEILNTRLTNEVVDNAGDPLPRVAPSFRLGSPSATSTNYQMVRTVNVPVSTIKCMMFLPNQDIVTTNAAKSSTVWTKRQRESEEEVRGA